MKKQILLLCGIVALTFSSCQKKFANFQASKYEDYAKSQSKKPLKPLQNEELVSITQPSISSFEEVIPPQKVGSTIAFVTNNDAIVESVIISESLNEKLQNQAKSLEIQQIKKKVGIKEKLKVAKKLSQIKKQTKTNGKAGTDQIVALLLVALVGTLGIHRFYLGYTAIGIIQLLTLGGCGIWALIDLIMIITGDLKPYNSEYTRTI